MSNKRILKIYFFILIFFFVLLAAFIVLPFTIAPSYIHILYGENLLCHEAISIILLNLLYGLISSTVLALFIAFHSNRCDILKDETTYVYDIQNIVYLCEKAIEIHKVDQLLDFIKLHQGKSFLLLKKPYKTCFLHFVKTKKNIQLSTEKIEEQIKILDVLCRQIINEELNYSKQLNFYGQAIAKMMYYSHDKEKHEQYKKEVAELSRHLCICEESKNKLLEDIIQPTRDLNDALRNLNRYLYRHTNDI